MLRGRPSPRRTSASASGRSPAGRACRSRAPASCWTTAIARAAFDAAAEAGQPASGVFAYVANAIRARGREIPYSVIAAADLGQGALRRRAARGRLRHAARRPRPRASPIWLNEWAWKDLGVRDRRSDRRSTTTSGRRRRAWSRGPRGSRWLASSRSAATWTPRLAPDVPGVTGARTLRAWDPPFPLDLSRIRPEDEDYWERYRGTPKAFVTLAAGQALWQSRFGRLTAVRVALSEADARRGARGAGSIPRRPGSPWRPSGATGSTPRAERSTWASTSSYFSFFLIVAAVLLSASFFRLGVEQRVARDRDAEGGRVLGRRRSDASSSREGAILLRGSAACSARSARSPTAAPSSPASERGGSAPSAPTASTLHVSWSALAAGIGVGARGVARRHRLDAPRPRAQFAARAPRPACWSRGATGTRRGARARGVVGRVVRGVR